VAAARPANAHEFIEKLPEGYHAPLAERGGGQGQCQLLAIARAVLADPRILILDDATSSIDTRTEALIQDALQTLLRGRTSFVIATPPGCMQSAASAVMPSVLVPRSPTSAQR
jgi:ABC-type multidrug transport system fused ATPase/permease subunit